MRLSGKVAIVTGAASGIGLGISQLFIKEGAKVVFSDINEAGKAAAVHAAAVSSGRSDGGVGGGGGGNALFIVIFLIQSQSRIWLQKHLKPSIQSIF